MNRRDTLKTLLAASGSLLVLPGWAKEWTVDGVSGHRSSFSLSEQEVLSSVCDTIIPVGNSLGALTVGVDKFLQKLIDKCYDGDVQANVKAQLAELESAAQTAHGQAFPACTQPQREQLLLQFSASDNKAKKEFFDLVKSETIRGFNTSKEVMVNFQKYKMVPGHYYGCVDVKI